MITILTSRPFITVHWLEAIQDWRFLTNLAKKWHSVYRPFFSSMGLRSFSHFCPTALYYGKKYNRSIDDASSYLALADVEGVPLITASQALHNAIKKELRWVKRLGDV